MTDDTMTKSVGYYLGLPYTIDLHQDAEEGWFVRVKELPGCMSQGDTADDALASIREVMPLWIETALESGYEIPQPCAEDKARSRSATGVRGVAGRWATGSQTPDKPYCAPHAANQR